MFWIFSILFESATFPNTLSAYLKIFLKTEKKVFFFENFFGPDFDPNSENVAKEWKSQISNYRLETFSSVIFIPKITF